ncbi:MAG TPA: thioredoxin [Candidatus Dormibacteraeota bacterium]|nr:thioredoxin [Candidatus Dormibacteraeota bacterium]
MSSAVPAVTDAEFQTEVLDADQVVLVDFWAEWCGPCRMIAPVVESLASELGERIKVRKMDIDANPEVPSKLGIMSIPTLIIFKDGQAAERSVGYRSGLKTALREKIEALLV